MQYLWIFIFLIFSGDFLINSVNENQNKHKTKAEINKDLIIQIQNDQLIYYLNSLNLNSLNFKKENEKLIFNEDKISDNAVTKLNDNTTDGSHESKFEKIVSNILSHKDIKEYIFSSFMRTPLSEIVMCRDIVILTPGPKDDKLSIIHIFNSSETSAQPIKYDDNLFAIHIEHEAKDLIGACLNQKVMINNTDYYITGIIKPFNFELIKAFLIDKKETNETIDCTCENSISYNIRITDLNTNKILYNGLFNLNASKKVKRPVGKDNLHHNLSYMTSNPPMLNYIATALQHYNRVVIIADKILLNDYFNTKKIQDNSNYLKEVDELKFLTQDDTDTTKRQAEMHKLAKQYIHLNQAQLNPDNLVKIEAWGVQD